MDILFHAALAAAVLLGLSSSSSYSGGTAITSDWNDTVGSRLTSDLNAQISASRREAENMNRAVDEVRKLKPIEYNSHASDINDCLRRINGCLG